MSATTLTTVAAPTTWQLDSSHMDVGFAVRHLMISTVKGRFTKVTGTVTSDGEDFSSAEVDVTIDASSIDTREPRRDDHLRSADFLDVEQFPTLTFKSRRVQPRGDGAYALAGDLTIHGVTREVTLDVVTEGFARDPWGGERAGFSATGHIKRSEFGLTWNAALETGGVLVGDDVKLHIDVELTKAK